MKKIKNILSLLVMALMGLSLAACSSDELDTNQYQDGVHLNVYGPQPVMRGGQLRFLGSNLDQIAQVKIPGCEAITNIEVVQAGNPSEIRVTVPKDGPEVGYVTLVTKTDEEITTKTKLTYKEAIVFDSFSSESVMPGETLTINGDYLNLVHMIEFADGVRVSENDFVSHDRYKIEVVVPAEARTGKVNLLDADLSVEDAGSVTYNIVTTEKALNVGTPTITKWSSPRGEAELTGNVIAKAEETITVTGQHFDLVEKFSFEGEETSLELNDFTVSEDGKTLTLSLPYEAPDGEFKLITRSGVEIPVGTMTTVKPSGCVASPSPVKAGEKLVITGKDLDLISSVKMTNVDEEINFTVNDNGTQLTIASVPAKAQGGKLVLNMLNGSKVEVAFTLVEPTVTSYSAANAGAVVTLTGTNLDLVKSVQFGEGADIAAATASADGKTLTVTIPMNAKSGKPTLILNNDTKVEAPELQIAEALFCYVTEIPSDEPVAGKMFTVPVKNGDKLQKVYFNGTEVAHIYTDGESCVTFNIPANVKSSSTVKFESSNGSYEFTLAFKAETSIWTGTITISGWNGDQSFAWGGYDWTTPKAGQILRFYYTKITVGSWGCLALRHGQGWANLPSPVPSQYELSDDEDYVAVELTAEILQDLVDNGGLVITGDNCTVTEITLE